MEWILAGFGGCIGAMLRYGIGWLSRRWWHGTALPIATMTANLLGCLLIGILAARIAPERTELRTFAIVGVLGGFTTFSAFGYETFLLLREGAWILATLNVTIQVVLGVGGVALGFRLGS